jgi:hypothetical protein
MSCSSLLFSECEFVIVYCDLVHTFVALRVRKLTGKPGVVTPPDCEFEARRIHTFSDYEIVAYYLDADSKTVRIHSDLLLRDLAIAACICLASGGVNLAANKAPLAFCVPIFGLPTPFFLIIVNINVDAILFSVNNNCNIKIDMANNLPTEKKTMAIAMLCEGSSIRAIERVTGVHRDTIMRLGVRVVKGSVLEL